MESPKSHAAKLLQSKQGMSRKLMVFVGLALAVVLATTAVLALRAEAMNYTRRELTCACELHVHTLEECGEPDARTCGLADYVVHVHNDDCYDGNGKLVCPLKEERPHTHDASCLEEQKVLICEQDGISEAEAAALAASYDPDHEHTEACYVPGERVLSCGQEEREAHAHTEACYTPGERVLSCGQAEQAGHTHSGDCYTSVLTCAEEHDHTDGCYTSELSCGQEEQAGHAHTDDCYTAGAPVLSCGQDEHEAHTHTDDCYAEGAPVLTCDKGKEAQAAVPQHVHTDACYETVSELTCGKLELHTHEDECYRIIKPGDPDYETYKQEDTPANEEIRLLICEIPQLEEHVHGGECFTVVELSPDEVAALKAQEAGIELHDLQAVYEDANVRVTVDYDTLSLVPEPAEAALLNANTPLPEPTPNPLLVAEGEPEAAAPEEADMPADAATPEDEGTPADAEPAAGSGTEPAAEPETVPAPEAAPAADENEALAAAGGSEAPEMVRAGLMAEGREWLPAATVTYTVQYLDNGRPIGEPAQYVYTPGGEMPTFPRCIARYYRECRTDAFIVTARYTALAQIPEEAELRASIITDEETVSAHEAEYRAALHSEQAQMVSLMDIGFWLNEEEIQPAAPVEITVQLLGEDGLPAGEPITVVHFAAAGTEVLPANVDEKGAASFEMNGFSLIGLGYGPEADEDGRVTLDHTFDWMDENGLFQMTFHVTGVAGPQKQDAADAGAAEAGEPDDENDAADAASDANEEDAPAPADGEGAAAGAPEDAAGDEANEPEAAAEPPLANASYLAFAVEVLPDTDPAYAAYEQFAGSGNDEEELLNFAVMRYALAYNGVAMDLSGCEIEVTITPTEKMELGAAAYRMKNPADNGDEDGDGYVYAADGVSMLPAPEAKTAVLFSAIAPEVESEEALSAQGVLEIGGEKFENLLEDADMAEIADAVFFEEAPAIGGELSVAFTQDAASQQSITFMMPPEVDVAPDMARTFAASMAADTNPTFTVQYYAMLQKVQLATQAGTNALPVIDTSAGSEPGATPKMPRNGTGVANTPNSNALLFLQVYGVNHENRGQVITELTPTEVYASKTFDYMRAPELVYTNLLIENGHYEDNELWVLKTGGDAAGMIETDWYIYTDLEKQTVNGVTANGIPYVSYTYRATDKSTGEPVTLSFTNNNHDFPQPSLDEESGITYIPVNNQSVIRWVYNATSSDQDVSAAFYDYDISGSVTYHDGGNTFLFDTAGGKGINAAERTGSGAKFAFGNANTGTGLNLEEWQGNRINATNGSVWGPVGANSYQGCAYGMVTGINAEKNNVVFASGISAPQNLFGPGAANGKHQYEGNLTFSQSGDTFTLSRASVGGWGSISGLEGFSNPSIYDGIRNGKTIWTNNFWPMDNAPADKRTDRNFGAGIINENGGFEIDNGAPKLDETQLGLYSLNKYDNGVYSQKLPVSDDAKAHNSYFGMYYQVSFELVKEYIGPLEYYFYGDDDMWVFLDETLVCDIGGVHSSVGEYVNLWDYLEKGSEGKHMLTFFYTERGASGSSCWMQFTLPNVSSMEPPVSQEEYGSLRVEKTVTKYTSDSVGGEKEETSVDSGDYFKFKLTFTAPGGQTIPDIYHYSVYEKGTNEPLINDVMMFNQGIFSLKGNQYIIIENLPSGITYTVTEIDTENASYSYDTDVFVNGKLEVQDERDWEKKIATGTIQGSHVEEVQFENKYYVFGLPETGNSTTPEWYVMGGAAILLAVAVVWRKRRKKART